MSPSDPFNDALNAWSTLAGGLARGPSLAASPLNAVLLQAHLASTAALMRSSQRASQSWLEYTQAVADCTDLAPQIDAARAHLRRLAEISTDEAHQIEQQMRKLDDQAQALAAPVDSNAEPVRRARAKL